MLVIAAAAGVVLAVVALIDDDRIAGGATSPDAAVSAYVAAFNARDGEAICRLLAPEVAGTIGPALDERIRAARKRGCAQALDEGIDRPSDAEDPELSDETYSVWSRASVRSRDPARLDGDRARVDLRLRHQRVQNDPLNDTRTRIAEEVEDRIWLQRLDGRWFIARVAGIFHEATGYAQGDWTLDGPLTAAAARRPSRLPPPPGACAGPARRIMRYSDRDRPGARIAPYLDIRAVSVRAMRSGGACVSVTLAAAPRPATKIGVVIEYRFNRPELIRYPTGRFLGCAQLSLRFDSAGRTHADLFRGQGEIARGSAGGRESTIVFHFGPARGGDQIRLRVGVLTDTHRGVAPDRAARIDTFPDDSRFLRTIPGSRPLPSSCASERAGPSGPPLSPP